VKGYAKHPNSPGFFCCSEEKQSGICSSSTEAINACYKEKLEHEKSTVQVFINNAFAKLYSTSDPNKVWLNIDRFSNYTEKYYNRLLKGF
ncbi:15141_t:CDS:2, partial [Funneliformis geosporum]